MFFQSVLHKELKMKVIIPKQKNKKIHLLNSYGRAVCKYNYTINYSNYEEPSDLDSANLINEKKPFFMKTCKECKEKLIKGII